MRFWYSYAIALLILFGTCTSSHSASNLTDRQKEIDTLIETQIERWRIPGLAIAIIDAGETVLAKGYGVHTLGQGSPVNAETVFAIASNSKAFTCAALCMLADEGKLKWSDPVVKYFPDFQLKDPERTRQLIVRDLVTHRSGVQTADRMWIDSEFSFEELLHRMRLFESIADIRTQYRYHNLMFNVAGKVLENISGSSWHDFIHRRIFDPLHMTRSGTRTSELPKDGNYVSPHDHLAATDEVVPLPYWIEREHIAPAGSVQSCANDLARWMTLLVNQGEFEGKRLISQAQAGEMQSPQTIRSTERYNQLGRKINFLAYGMGHNVYEYQGYKFVQHSGTLNWQRSFICMIPEKKFGVAVLSNRVTAFPYALAYTVADMAIENEDAPNWIETYWKEYQDGLASRKAALEKRNASRVAGTKPSLPLASYTGTFTHDLYGAIEITLENDALSYCINGADWMKGPLEHWHYDTFLMKPEFDKDEENLMTFVLDENAKISRIVLDGDDYLRSKD